MRHRLMVHFQTFFNDLIGLLCNCNPPALGIFLLAARKKYANTGMVFARRLIVITVQFLLLVNINIIFSRLKHFPHRAGWSELQIGWQQPLHVTGMTANGRVAVCKCISASLTLIARKWKKWGAPAGASAVSSSPAHAQIRLHRVEIESSV